MTWSNNTTGKINRVEELHFWDHGKLCGSQMQDWPRMARGVKYVRDRSACED